MAKLRQETGRSRIALERIGNDRIGQLAGEYPGPEPQRRPGIGPVIQREARGEVIIVPTFSALGSKAVILPAQAQRCCQLGAELPFVLDISGDLRLARAERLLPG